MLPSIKILQIGDIHFPSSSQSITDIDDHGKGFPQDIRAMVCQPLLERSFKNIYRLIESSEIDCVLFMGDFTDRGDKEGLKHCCEYITNSLQIGCNGKYNTLPVGIVPGNHDINWNDVDKSDVYRKFCYFNCLLKDYGLPEIPINQYCKLPVKNGEINTTIHLLNSCMGAGEMEQSGDDLWSKINETVKEKLINNGAEITEDDYYGRQLDIPALCTSTMNDMFESIQGNDNLRATIITAHHNLLPQRTTRLSPYAELVNSGALRGTLMEQEQPSIYLHGHIHQDPIEIIRLPKGYPLITISAPELSTGFNVIEIIFTSYNKPLACRIQPYRFDQSGHMKKEAKKVGVNLINGPLHLVYKNLNRFYADLLSKDSCYWEDIRGIFNQVYHETEEGAHENPDELIIELLQLLEIDGTIQIKNLNMPHWEWIVHAK